MMYTFFKAMGLEIGRSILDGNGQHLAGDLLKKAEAAGVGLTAARGCRYANGFKEDTRTCTVKEEIPADMMGMDIGPETEKLFCQDAWGRHHGLERTYGRVRNGKIRIRYQSGGQSHS